MAPSASKEEHHHQHSSDSSSASARRLAAIAGQLGSVTSSSVQVLSSSRRHPSSSSSHSSSSSSSRSHKEWRHLPSFSSLPREGGFPGCAWSVWGKGDELGTVNLLTDSVVLRTAKDEIRTGHTVSLNLPLHLPLKPFFHRKALDHTIWGKKGGRYQEAREAVRAAMGEQGHAVQIRAKGEEAAVSDEEIHLNSQSGTQWDGLRHFGHLTLDCFYQGVPRDAIQSTFGTQKHDAIEPAKDTDRLGIQSWARHGICGRAVLLDVWGYLQAKAAGGGDFMPYDPMTSHAISVDLLQEVARAQGVRFRQADILLVRLGFTQRYLRATPAEREQWEARSAAGKEELAGLEQGQAMLEFLWDHHFAAVGSDMPALERWPAPRGATYLHETLLTFFGMPIGELFDLERLVEHCRATRRWSFFLSSWPLNLHGGVASPANAAALF